MEPEGILKGSTRKERSRKTIRMTGKKLLEYSTSTAAWLVGAPLLRNSRSSSQMEPVMTSSRRG
jgi:hypothetical protein